MTTATETKLIVAETILAQLGGRKFIAMTGAKHLIGGDKHLSFQLPSRFATDGINAVTITLAVDDTYTIKFRKLHGMKLKEMGEVAGVYCDQLRAVFTARTGLHCTL